ncbi:MAG: Asp-tRNA(Asn)/Glu-tRNA(Gln) amidotransferase subunit GatC [Anaerovoracaceae bacterium]|nr:Asp-tRNA(Asn)/Glu-tRNA(Gln) amidotransferase subunit GatC [Bacillota bacterium]MDY2670735.1 Asp-tRNA(Asn)/Glu-tRNA(Gln) amidotransferase subunit GatC [Anaerovoracaceae bacterium]
MQINEDLIGYLGDLSRLYLSDDEKKSMESDLTDILNYVDKLSELDTAGMPEMSHPFEDVNSFREDEVVNHDDRERLLANAPEKRGSYFKVFKTVE